MTRCPNCVKDGNRVVRCDQDEGHDLDVPADVRVYTFNERYENPEPGKAYLSGHKMTWTMGEHAAPDP